MRPHQWTKNLACLAGLFFAGKALDPICFMEAIAGFAAFCIGSSFVYALNDVIDCDKDRAHPIKALRPLPSGRLGLRGATAVAGACLVAALLLAWTVRPSVLYLVAAYIALNLAYSLSLKHVVLVDVMIISCGFILRILVGTEAIAVKASAWILLCAFFLSLFLGFGKRLAEITLWSGNREQPRRVLSEYSAVMLDRFCSIFATLSIASYALFTVTARLDHTLLVTCPPVVFGLLRYLLLIEGHNAGESPDLILLHERPLQAAILLWMILTSLVIYFGLRLPLL
jgi:4-hydroxybenzoate polyprenyltransferase